MQCTEFQAYAPLWLEGERAPDAQAHVESCPRCRGFVSELESISAAAREMEAVTPEPPERVWVALRAQLEAEGVIRDAEPVEAGWSKLWSDMNSGIAGLVRRPALAAAYAAVLVAALLMTGGPLGHHQEIPTPGLGSLPLVKLRDQMETSHTQAVAYIRARNPAVETSYRQSLELVDNFIALCEKTVRKEPTNEIAREYLFAAYQHKAELLSNIMAREVGD